MRQLHKSLLAMVLIVTLLSAILVGCGKHAEEVPATTQPIGIEAMDITRQPREGIQTILVSCLDTYSVEGQSGYRNANRADFLLLLLVDEQSKKITSVQINPDTVVPFEIPGKAETVELPVGLLQSYGSGGSDSCLHISNAVSDSLGGVRIDHFLSFTREAIPLVNDAIGGVTVPKEAVFENELEPETMLLSGEEAASFFFARNQDDMANEIHMEQQRRYMKGLYPSFMAAVQDENFLSKLSLQLGERMITDLTLSQLILMFETLAAYEMEEEIVTFAGVSQSMDGVFCFYPDDESVKSKMEKLIY